MASNLTDPTYIANLKNLVDSRARPDLAPTLASLQAQNLVAPAVQQTQGGTLSVSELQPQTSVNLQGTANVDTAQASTAMAGVPGIANGWQSYIQPEVETPESIQNTALMNEVNNLLPELKGRADYQLATEQGLGIPGISKQLADINAQVLAGNAEYTQMQNAYDSLSVENRGKPITMSSIVGNEAQIDFARQMKLRTKAADVNLLVARGQGLQGQLEAAQRTADRAVDLKYSAIEDEINIKMKQLELIAPILDKQEKKQAAAWTAYYNDQKERAAEKKEKEKANINLALQAGIITPFYNYAGEIRNTRTGEAYATPSDFFNVAGVSTFNDAYNRGLITDYNPTQISEQSSVQDLASRYSDAGITLSDSLEEASQKIKNNSRIYQKETYIAPSGGANPGLDAMLKMLQIQKAEQDLSGVVPGDNQKKLDKFTSIIDAAKSLLDDPSLGAAVGTISSKIPTLRGDTADFERTFEQLRGLLTLDNIGLLKGVLSDADMKIIKEASTKLNLNMSEQGFRDELQKIIDKTNIGILNLQSNISSPNSMQSQDVIDDPLGLF